MKGAVRENPGQSVAWGFQVFEKCGLCAAGS